MESAIHSGQTAAERDKRASGALYDGASLLIKTNRDPARAAKMLDEYLANVHRNYLKKAMEEASGVKSKAARLLGLANYQTLDARLKKLKVQWDS